MKDKIMSISFTIFIIGFLILGIIIPDKDISYEERRKLSSIPKFNVREVLDGDYFKDLSSYLVEQFPFRSTFRKIKGTFSKVIYNKKENNGVFIKNDGIYQLNSNYNAKSVDHILNLINRISTKYEDNDLYYSIIPDKNYYLEDDNIPRFDYNRLVNTFKKNLPKHKYIDIFDSLDLSSYYRTDIHWRQEKLDKVLKTFTDTMNLEQSKLPDKINSYDSFYGALYGRIASNIKSDTINYLNSDILDNTTLYNYEKKEYQPIYDSKNLKNIDSYDVFLSGATPLLILENKASTSDRELIVFRDSFGSSFIPLLVPNYKKITVIDLRYLKSEYIDKIEEIKVTDNSDILFMYSVPIINESFTLN